MMRTPEEAEKLTASLSPGPGWPADAGKMEALIKDLVKNRWNLLKVPGYYETFGGKLGLAKNVMHGKQSNITLKRHRH